MAYKLRSFKCIGCGNMVSHRSIPTRKYCSHECYLNGKRNQADNRDCLVCSKPFKPTVQQVEQGLGKYCSRICYFTVPKSNDFKDKISNAMRGNKHPNWKGGVMKGRKDRNLVEYKEWRKFVFARDRYTCVFCNARNHPGLGYSVQLEADHIKSWTDYPELRYEISNGRTLCKSCHSKRTAEQHRERMKNVA